MSVLNINPIQLEQCFKKYHERVKFDVNQLMQLHFFYIKEDTYVQNDGSTHNLLLLDGTTSIQYRGGQYRIPISIWIGLLYPQQAPFCYVVPTNDMELKCPHPSVDTSGRIYIPYLQQWNEKCNLIGLISSFSHEFSQNPPVFSKVKQPQFQSRPIFNPIPPSNTSMFSTPFMSSTGTFPPGSIPSFPVSPSQPTSPIAIQPQSPQNVQQSQSPLSQNIQQSQSASPITTSQQNNVQPAPSSPSSQNKLPQAVKELQSQLTQKELQSQLTKKVQQNLNSLNDFEQLEKTNLTLRNNLLKIDTAIIEMERYQKHLGEKLQILDSKNEEITRWLEEFENSSFNIDEAVVPLDPHSRQMFELVAEDNAIEDTIYQIQLIMANNHSTEMDPEVLLKQIRTLSREQFLIRALIQKIYLLQQQNFAKFPSPNGYNFPSSQ